MRGRVEDKIKVKCRSKLVGLILIKFYVKYIEILKVFRNLCINIEKFRKFFSLEFSWKYMILVFIFLVFIK